MEHDANWRVLVRVWPRGAKTFFRICSTLTLHSLEMTSWRLLVPIFGLLVIWSSVCSAQMFHCDNAGQLCEAWTPKAFFQVKRAMGYVMLMGPDGTPVEDGPKIGLGFKHFTERKRGEMVNGTRMCVGPRSGGDPLSTDPKFDQLLSNYTLDTMPYTFENLLDHPVLGIHTIRYNFTINNIPVITLAYGISDRDIDIPVANESEYSRGLSFNASYKYVKTACNVWHPWNLLFALPHPLTSFHLPLRLPRTHFMKMSLSIMDFPWTLIDDGSGTNTSFITAFLNVSCTCPSRPFSMQTLKLQSTISC